MYVGGDDLLRSLPLCGGGSTFPTGPKGPELEGEQANRNSRQTILEARRKD